MPSDHDSKHGSKSTKVLNVLNWCHQILYLLYVFNIFYCNHPISIYFTVKGGLQEVPKGDNKLGRHFFPANVCLHKRDISTVRQFKKKKAIKTQFPTWPTGPLVSGSHCIPPYSLSLLFSINKILLTSAAQIHLRADQEPSTSENSCVSSVYQQSKLMSEKLQNPRGEQHSSLRAMARDMPCPNVSVPTLLLSRSLLLNVLQVTLLSSLASSHLNPLYLIKREVGLVILAL
jgi:hypothetical protein